MRRIKYKIYELSVRAILAHAELRDGEYTFHLSAAVTDKCKMSGASHEQDDNALFYQTMCELHKSGFSISLGSVVGDLSDIIFYADFSGIFDRSAYQKNSAERQKKAEAMFAPSGVTLDFGSGAHRYLAFERSGNMSRSARLSFIREDYYEPVRRRIMLDMKIGNCQLSKLYAYNGLMLSGGVRIDGIGIDKPHRVIVIDNPKRTLSNINVITVTDDGSDAPVRKYSREERRADVDFIEFDGEGLVSREYAKVIDRKYCGGNYHTSFQIRMPFVKGMLHAVDFKDFLTSAGTETVTDMWGVSHPVRDVDIILTKSMFKGYSWLYDNNMTWDDYFAAFRKYDHALYITNVSKETPEEYTELNYQFLNTVSLTAEEFRPADLPDGWDHSPCDDSRTWLTKETEARYYNLCCNNDFRMNCFLDILKSKSADKSSRKYRLARILKKNPLVINEPVFADELDYMAEKTLENYSLGKLIVPGDNRYLSGDLLRFLVLLVDLRAKRNRSQSTFFSAAMSVVFAKESFYAPDIRYRHDVDCTLLRNPHIARNEEAQLHVYPKPEQIRKHYFGHLTDVVMLDCDTLVAQRLGGADYDGDMVKTIADPIVNACVKRNYEYEKYKVIGKDYNIPLLQIPTAEPLIRDANNWHARFETVKSTFSSRVGQISNAALDRSIIAYNENSDSALRKCCREETETLAILTGLEIDSAKSGVKPELSEYLGKGDVSRSLFLKYKKLTEDAETRRAWYEPTHREKLKAFFEKTDWRGVDSNVERLPYLAYQLKRNTQKLKPRPVSDKELFTFAGEDGWQDSLDPAVLSAVKALLDDYEACLSRIRACRAEIKSKARRTDIERILFARNQEDDYDTDELYALMQTMPPEKLAALRSRIAGATTERRWHMMHEAERERFLDEWLPESEFAEYFDLLSDFRFGGYRVLGDLICDIDDENSAKERKQLVRDADSDAFRAMMEAYRSNPGAKSYKEAVGDSCRELLGRIIKPGLAVRYMVALGKRKQVWELLPDEAEKIIIEQ